MNNINPLNTYFKWAFNWLGCTTPGMPSLSSSVSERSPSDESSPEEVNASEQSLAMRTTNFSGFWPQEQRSLACLGHDCLVQVFKWLRISDCESVALACRQFSVLLSRNDPLFREFLKRHFPQFSSHCAPAIEDYWKALEIKHYSKYLVYSFDVSPDSHSECFCVNQDHICSLGPTGIEVLKRDEIGGSCYTFPLQVQLNKLELKREHTPFRRFQFEGNFLFVGRTLKSSDSLSWRYSDLTTICEIYELDRNNHIRFRFYLKLPGCRESKCYINKQGKPVLLTLSKQNNHKFTDSGKKIYDQVIQMWELNDKNNQLEPRTILTGDNFEKWVIDVEYDFEQNQLFLAHKTGEVTIWKQNKEGFPVQIETFQAMPGKIPIASILFKEGFFCIRNSYSKFRVWKKNPCNYSLVLDIMAGEFSFHHKQLVTILDGRVKLYKVNREGNLEELQPVEKRLTNHYCHIWTGDKCIGVGGLDTIIFYDFAAPKKKIFEQLETSFRNTLYSTRPLCEDSLHLKQRLLAMPERDLDQIFENLRVILNLASNDDARDAFDGKNNQICTFENIADAIHRYLHPSEPIAANVIRLQDAHIAPLGGVNQVALPEPLTASIIESQDEEVAASLAIDQMKTIERFTSQLQELRRDPKIECVMQVALEAYQYGNYIHNLDVVSSPEVRRAMREVLLEIRKLLASILEAVVRKQKEQEAQIDLLGDLEEYLNSGPEEAREVCRCLDHETKELLRQCLSEIIGKKLPLTILNDSFNDWSQGTLEQKQKALEQAISILVAQYHEMANEVDKIESRLDKINRM
jgi:hypothetical protein